MAAARQVSPGTDADEVDPGTYRAAVARLFARQPQRMVPDLDRITTLAQLLDRPDQSYPSVHVTGTNGKTSMARMVGTLLRALGLNPGTYTSPHLQDVRERIRVAGEPLSRAAFVEGLAYLEPFLAEADARHPDRVTFFEVLTALAYLHFADAPVDVGVFEVGMGGRWDATNLVRGEVAVIGPVGVDHPELGPTPAAIAREKAGIIKPGAVVVSAAQLPEVAAVIAEAAAARDARLLVAGRDFAVEGRALSVGGQVVDLRGVTGDVEDILLPVHGRHQAANAACALAAVEAFLGLAGGLDPELIRAGFAAVTSPGRLEVVPRADGPTIVLDGAHNPDGARTLVRALTEEFAFRHRVLVLAILDDKDVEAMVEALLPACDHLVVTAVASPRAANPERLEKAARASGRLVERAPDVATALELATGVAGPGDGVIVTGSLYAVGAARDLLGLPVT